MTRYAAEIEYNGKYFHGFQKQPGLQTIQGSLERSLLTITGQEIRVQGAGRTDTGVHAVGQVVAFDVKIDEDQDRFMKRINSILPTGVAIYRICIAPDKFNPRRDALWREYRYFFLPRNTPSPILGEFSYHYPWPIDRELIDKACAAAVGEHDFSAFRVKAQEESNVREILRCEFVEDIHGLLSLVIKANSFLHKMSRILGGAILSVGSGRMALESFTEFLEGGSEPCSEPLPPNGLFLWKVDYPEDKLKW